MPDGLIRARADFQPSTMKDGTIKVVFATNKPVRRGGFNEVLSLKPGHIDLSRLIGASVLNGHQQGDVRSVLGIILDAKVENGEAVATLKLSSREDVAPIVRDIADGVIRHVSVGYSVQKWTDSTDASGQCTRTAVAWTPHEISFVPVPADSGTTTRSGNMPDNIVNNDNPNAETRAQVNAQIRSIAELVGLDDTWTNGQIDAEASADDARRAAFEAMRTRTTPTIRTQQVGPSNDDPAIKLTRMAGALAARMGVPMADESRPYANMGMIDMARAMLVERGVAGVHLLGKEETLTRAMATLSDFPNLLTETGNRVLQSGYQLAASPIKALARQRTAPDFRPLSVLKLGDFDTLQEVTESGEITGTSTAEAKESYSVKTLGRMFRVSRKDMINDDLGALGRWGTMMGKAAAETETSLLLSLLLQNSGAGPTMEDGNPLFHASHGNIAAAGAAPSVTTLSDGRLAMRTQRGLEGKMPINVAPKTLLVGADLETTSEQILASLSPVAVDDVNPFSGRLSLAVESRLPAKAWYLFADPAAAPVLEYAYLSSAQGPQLASRDGWDVLAREFRVVLDFGCGAVDWRGVYRNPGQ
ncbi:prohead protease/major capsid protein fusion protein [Enhydrobacter sp.]|jgi:phage head maturation protease|uniref:prohead protease/major capsid protein fusion protein n=1 Tax=Enhydrobacter sp. TaxID=1894999 RepID=UPI002636BB1E|nr:prohead protease/major capsid protein fusion protein [Enhydrobacter sp.]WIM10596.1 MAG: ATP-dependent Clp protease proteolytic subunit [Enhydrobacter sp.]